MIAEYAGIPEYTMITAVSMIGVILLEVIFLRTGLLRTVRYWITMIIVWGFQVLVDGWLTKLSAPIVIYRQSETLGIRFPWDIPVEDFGFGFSMVTLTLLLWQRTGRLRRSAETGRAR